VLIFKHVYSIEINRIILYLKVRNIVRYYANLDLI